MEIISISNTVWHGETIWLADDSSNVEHINGAATWRMLLVAVSAISHTVTLVSGCDFLLVFYSNHSPECTVRARRVRQTDRRTDTYTRMLPDRTMTTPMTNIMHPIDARDT